MLTGVSLGHEDDKTLSFLKLQLTSRCKFGHQYEPGYTDLSGNCVVQGVKESEYQVLVDMFDMARLEWKVWDMFMVPSLGSVAYNEKTFVGQMVPSGTEQRRMAELDYGRGLNGEFVLEVSPDIMDSKTEGWVLVETEPIKYSMENVTFLTEKVVSREPVHLGEVSLEREGEGGGWSEVSQRLEYSWSAQESWGNIGGTVRGLPCTVTRQGATSHTRMGLTTTSSQTGDLLVSFMLLPGAGVNISVSGEMVVLDEVYTATMMSVHKDGSLAVTNITGVRTSRGLTNVTTSHSGPVWLQSGLPAPTTAAPSTTTTGTTSSPPASTASSQQTRAAQFRAASPTPTLFPPAPPPVTR